MQETRNNCFKSKKRSTTLRKVFLNRSSKRQFLVHHCRLFFKYFSVILKSSIQPILENLEGFSLSRVLEKPPMCPIKYRQTILYFLSFKVLQIIDMHIPLVLYSQLGLLGYRRVRESDKCLFCHPC